MSLPPHLHGEGVCPVTKSVHAFCPPQTGDSRGPCPALNAMANHGYIARDGKRLTPFDLIKGLKACYGLSTFLAMFISFGGFLLLKRITPVSLFEMGEHGAVEHDASLVHHDTPTGQRYAPIEIDPFLAQKLMDDAHGMSGLGKQRELMTPEDVARARIRRELECRPIDAVHAEIARGEMAIILGVWETEREGEIGAPMEWIRDWFSQEMLPEGWRPNHVQGMFDVVRRSRIIKTAMEEQRGKGLHH